MAQVPAEAVLVQLLARGLVPETAGIRGDLIGQDNGAVGQTAELQLKVHQGDPHLLEEVLQQRIDPEGQGNNGIDLLLGGQLQGPGVVGIDEGVPQGIVLIGKLNGGLVKNDALLHPVVLGEMSGRNVSDNDLQGNDGYLFHHGLPLVELLDKVGRDSLPLQHLHEQVGHAVVDGPLALNGSFLFSIEGGGVIFVLHDQVRGVVRAKDLLGLPLVQLL